MAGRARVAVEDADPKRRGLEVSARLGVRIRRVGKTRSMRR